MKTLLYISIFLFLTSCGTKETEPETGSTETSSESIKLTPEQEQMAEIETGKLQKRVFRKSLNCSGNIEPTPRSIASITAPYGGFIKEINYYIGKKVTKGDILAILENPEYIQLQEEYLSTLGEMEYLRQEYLRQGELSLDNAASVKTLQQSRADFKMKESRLLSLEAQLKILGIDASNIENNGFTSEIFLRAPINGFISEINGNLGAFVEPKDIIFEIIDPELLHLHLKIFEKDIPEIKNGQNVIFHTIAQPDNNYNAKVISVGNSINEKTHTVTVHASLSESNKELLPGLFVNAQIITRTDTLFSLPPEGVITNENNNYVFFKKSGVFQRLTVEPGPSDSNYQSIILQDQNILNSEFVLKGAYFIHAALEAGAEE